MNDTDLILGALCMAAPLPRKKKMIREIEPSDFGEDDENDAVWQVAKTIKRKPKAKPLRSWTSTDFMKYLNDSLKVYGLHLESASARDREVMSSLYDNLVRSLGDRMDNTVLKDYIDWWVAAYAPTLFGRKIYVSSLVQEFTLAKFLKRFEHDALAAEIASEIAATPAPAVAAPIPNQTVDDDTLYKMGGISMLLLSKGIVATVVVLRRHGVSDWIIRLSQAIRALSKEVVMEVVDTTIKRAPYNAAETCDFISLARPTLQYYGIKNYDRLCYQDYFSRD